MGIDRSTIAYQGSHPLSKLINQLRRDLLAQGFSFGCIFMGQHTKDGTAFGLFFADAMPRETRAQMLDDLETALKDARLYNVDAGVQ